MFIELLTFLFHKTKLDRDITGIFKWNLYLCICVKLKYLNLIENYLNQLKQGHYCIKWKNQTLLMMNILITLINEIYKVIIFMQGYIWNFPKFHI